MDNNKIDIKQVPNEIIILSYHLTFKDNEYFVKRNTKGSIEKHDELLKACIKEDFPEWYRAQVNEVEGSFARTIDLLAKRKNENEITPEECTKLAYEARDKKVEQLTYLSNVSLFRSQLMAQIESQVEGNLKAFEAGNPLLFTNRQDKSNLIFCRPGQVYECSHNQKRIDFYYDYSMQEKYDVLFGKVLPQPTSSENDDDEWGGNQ